MGFGFWLLLIVMLTLCLIKCTKMVLLSKKQWGGYDTLKYVGIHDDDKCEFEAQEIRYCEDAPKHAFYLTDDWSIYYKKNKNKLLPNKNNI